MSLPIWTRSPRDSRIGARFARSGLTVAARCLLALPLAIAVPAAEALVVPGCGCSDVAEPGLSVTVVDAATGARICDAIVTATDGSHTETLAPFGAGDNCQYFGAYERSGTYAVEASSGGRTGSMPNVVVTGGTCHVSTRAVTVTLPAAAAGGDGS
jgi:hypothetical protein